MDLLELEEGIIQSCNILSVESFMEETKETPFDWDPISDYQKNANYPDTYFHGKIYIQNFTESINKYCGVSN